MHDARCWEHACDGHGDVMHSCAGGGGVVDTLREDPDFSVSGLLQTAADVMYDISNALREVVLRCQVH